VPLGGGRQKALFSDEGSTSECKSPNPQNINEDTSTGHCLEDVVGMLDPDEDQDDPQLRQVLAQKPEAAGGSRR
jgi:hypothetical protein